MESYVEKVQKQIDQYKDTGNERSVADIQELPEIFHYWSNKHILPLIESIFSVANIFELYSRYFFASLNAIVDNNFLLSVGCGDCSFEIRVAQDLIKKGMENFVFECFDISPFLVKQSQERVDSLNLGKHFKISQIDINQWISDKTYCGVMAHQSLHHVVELERLFENIQRALHPKGVFVSSDMIGRNGHMRWPEALEIVNAIWNFMPDRLKFNHLWGCYEETYHNHDCSTEGFEGVRSQDVLPLLVEHFYFERFLAYGNIVDVFIERCFGPNFCAEDVKDRAFIDFLELLNGLLIDLGHIKPTMMFAVMRKEDGGRGVICHKHWKPEFCIRSTTVSSDVSRRVVKLPMNMLSIFYKIAKLICLQKK
jgi:SAM-dependent methyltransferase